MAKRQHIKKAYWNAIKSRIPKFVASAMALAYGIFCIADKILDVFAKSKNLGFW